MDIPSQDNPYALLAYFLSPWKDAETVETLAEAIRRAKVDWESLLYMANVHFCTPLWLARLQQDGLLPLLPSELQAYLGQLHQANLERNEALLEATKEILSRLQDLDIPVILLKGAATFCDNLYGDMGARMMVDVDFLVRPQHSQIVRKWLLRSGYYEPSEDPENSKGYFESYLPHHLPRFRKPGTPVAIEVHVRTARGQAGRVLPADLSWQHIQTETWEGLYPLVFVPSYRLLHNTVHALVPGKRFVGSDISLAQLAEFTYLVLRYGSAIDWYEWLHRGTSQGLGRQFRVYLNLAHRLMGMPLPQQVPGICLAGMHVARISLAANRRACLYERRNLSEGVIDRMKRLVIRIYASFHSRLTKPGWVWHNLCYKKGIWNVPMRLVCLCAFFINGKDIKKNILTKEA